MVMSVPAVTTLPATLPGKSTRVPGKIGKLKLSASCTSNSTRWSWLSPTDGVLINERLIESSTPQAMNATIALQLYKSDSLAFNYFEKVVQSMNLDPPVDCAKIKPVMEPTEDWGWPAPCPEEDEPLSSQPDIFSSANSHAILNTNVPSMECTDIGPIQVHNVAPTTVNVPTIPSPASRISQHPSQTEFEYSVPAYHFVIGTEVKDESLPPAAATVVNAEEGANAEEEATCNTTDLGGKRKAPEQGQQGGVSVSGTDSESNSSTAGKRRRGKQRGMFARLSPQIQQNARQGQQHWGQKVKEVRQEWTARCVWQKSPHFATQIAMCTRLHIKSQHECILRQLQLAAVDDMIVPLPFSSDENQSFNGWTGFTVVPAQAAEFRGRIESMFASQPNDKTLNNTMRRAGLIPKFSWSDGWEGKTAFLYNASKRAQYNRE